MVPPERDRKIRGFLFFMKKVILISIILSFIVLAIFAVIPFHWENQRCCDLPGEGTNYGWPLPYKTTSCCGLGGVPGSYFDWHFLIIDFLIYFVVIYIFAWLFFKFTKSKNNAV